MSDKYCKGCYKYLPSDNFHKTKIKTYLDGRINTCKECINNKPKVEKVVATFHIEKKTVVLDFD